MAKKEVTNVVKLFPDSSDSEFGLATVAELRANGELHAYLADLENFDAMSDTFLYGLSKDDPEVFNELATFLLFTMDELDKLADHELNQYDLTNLYETYNNFEIVINEEYEYEEINPIFEMPDITVEEFRRNGELGEFLSFCATYPPLKPEELKKLLAEGQLDLIKHMSDVARHSVEQIEKCTARERIGYNFGSLFEANELLQDLVSTLNRRPTNVVDFKAR